MHVRQEVKSTLISDGKYIKAHKERLVMNIAEYAIKLRKVTYVLSLLVVGVGIYAFTQLGRLEMPDFLIKIAVVTTPYRPARYGSKSSTKDFMVEVFLGLEVIGNQ